MVRDYSKPELVTHSRKTSDEIREAIAWLTEHGFKGHFYSVPPEVFDDFNNLQIVAGTDGFDLRVENENIHLWGPSLLDELTERQRHLIRDKFGMEPEEVCAKTKRKVAEYEANISKPATKKEKETAFKVTLYGSHFDLESLQGRTGGPTIRCMWPTVSAWEEQGWGVRSFKFHDFIGIHFHPKDPNSYPLSIAAKAPVIKKLVQELRRALRQNAMEVEKRAGKAIRDSRDSV